MPNIMDENGNVVDLSNNNVASTNNGKINAQGIASALGGAASAFGTAYSTYADVQNPKDWVQRANAFQVGPNYGGSSLDSWTQAFLNNRPLAHIGLSDVGYNTGKGVMNALGAGVQGAGAGASIGGGWGALAGGIIGTLGGLFGMGAAKRKAQRTVNRANEAIDYTNDFNMASLHNSLGNVTKNMNINAVRNAAFGGPLNMSGDGVLSPFGSRFSVGGPMHSYGADWTNGLGFTLGATSIPKQFAFGGNAQAFNTHGGYFSNGVVEINEGKTHEENPYEGVQMGIDPQGVPNLVEEGEVIWNDYVFSNRMKVPKKDRIKYKLTGPKNLTYAEAAKKAQKESEERPNDPISKRGLEEAMARLANSQEEQRQEEFMREIEKQAKELGMTPEELLYAMQQQQQQPVTAAYGGSIHIKPSKKGTFTAAASKHGMGVQEFASKVLANKDNYSPVMVKKANFAKNAAGWKHGLGGNLFVRGGLPFTIGTTPFMEPAEAEYQQFILPEWLKNNHFASYDENTSPSQNIFLPSTNGFIGPTPYAGKEFKADAKNIIYNLPAVDTSDFSRATSIKSPVLTPEQQSSVSNGVDTERIENEMYQSMARGNTGGSSSGYNWTTGLRYTPILASAISGIRNLLTPADYSRANDVERAYSNINDVKVTPKYNYMQYRPIDRMMMSNIIGQQAAATRRNIMNTSGGNRGTAIAALLASDNKYLNKLGEAFIAGDEKNYERYAQTLDTNNKINQWLGQLDLGVQEANQRAAEARARGVQLSRGMMDAIDAQRAAAISNDWTNVAQGLGDIGWEQFNRNMVNSSNPIYGIGEDGNVYFKGGERAESLMKKHLSADDYKAWKNAKVNSEEYAQLLSRAFVNMQRGKTFSKGGYLTIKGRRK